MFTRCLDDGMNPAVIPIVIKIAKGMHFSLAPFYLGSLYKRLDLYLSKTEISASQYKILAYVDVSFIQICLWERFRACAPTPNSYPSLGIHICSLQMVMVILVPSMIESSNSKVGRNSHSIKVYSMCRVARQVRYDHIAP